MLKSTKLKNTLLVGATAILVSCGGQKEIKMGSYEKTAYGIIPRTIYEI